MRNKQGYFKSHRKCQYNESLLLDHSPLPRLHLFSSRIFDLKVPILRQVSLGGELDSMGSFEDALQGVIDSAKQFEEKSSALYAYQLYTASSEHQGAYRDIQKDCDGCRTDYYRKLDEFKGVCLDEHLIKLVGEFLQPPAIGEVPPTWEQMRNIAGNVYYQGTICCCL